MKKWAKIRKRLRMTQFELSRKSGVQRWRIAYAELGYLRLRPEEMQAIRRVLNAPAQSVAVAMPSAGPATVSA